MPHQCTTCGHTFADGSKEMLSGCPDCGGNTFQFHPAGTDVPDQPPTEEPPEPEGGTATERMGRAATKVRDFVGGGSSDETGASEPATPSESTTTSTSEPTTATPESTASAPDADAPWPDDAGGEAASDTGDGDDSEIIDADARREAAEDRAQSSARGEIASPDEVADGAAQGPTPAEAANTTNATDTTEAEPGAGAGLGSNPSASGGGVSTSPTDSATADGDGPPTAEGRVVSEPTGEQPDIDELREQLNDQFESIKIVEPGQYELNLMELYNREEYIIALQENGRYVIQVPENWLGDRPGAGDSR